MTPEKRLLAVEELARAARVGWAAYAATSAALGQATMRSANLDGRVASSDVSDPVAGQAISHQNYLDNEARISEALGVMREVERAIHAVRRQHPEIARDMRATAEAARCDGSEDPTCVRNAVRRGMCWRCYQVVLQRERDTREAS